MNQAKEYSDLHPVFKRTYFKENVISFFESNILLTIGLTCFIFFLRLLFLALGTLTEDRLLAYLIILATRPFVNSFQNVKDPLASIFFLVLFLGSGCFVHQFLEKLKAPDHPSTTYK